PRPRPSSPLFPYATLFRSLAIARRGARDTGGLFDPTWAAVSDLWRFDGTEQAPPPDEAVRARCALVGWRGLELRARRSGGPGCEDRKSTRLNSSHVKISYA